MGTIIFKGDLFKTKDWQEFTGHDWIEWSRQCNLLSYAETNEQFNEAIAGIVRLTAEESAYRLPDFTRAERFAFAESTFPNTKEMYQVMSTLFGWTHRTKRKGFQKRVEAWFAADPTLAASSE